MTKLTIAPQVLAKLRQAHPTPAASAARLLDKYVGVLQGLIDDAMQQKRSTFMRKHGIYSVNVSTLHRCGQFGPKRTRLHKWLDDNELALIKIFELGTSVYARYVKQTIDNTTDALMAKDQKTTLVGLQHNF
jgi:hypothetical protein